jgi:hypothetical protein
MRGTEQHVERKIRLWVVAQERNRRREIQEQRHDTRTAERTEKRPDGDALAHE